MKLMPLLASLLLALSLPAAGQDPTTLAGTILVGPHISIDATEVTISEYTEFIIAKNYDSSLFPADQALPSDNYRSLFADLRKHEHKRTPLNNYPITAITYQQAVRYCEWLEEQTNKGRPLNQRIHIFLPSSELYQQLIPNYDTLSEKKRVKCDCAYMTFNYKHPPCVAGSKSCPAEFANPAWNLVRADAYYPSPEGIYNLLGNAAEMTAEPGTAMGGSYRHYAWECRADQSQHYSKPEDWLGFRYVITQ